MRLLSHYTSELPELYQNLFGAQKEGKGMIAVFPLSALVETNDLHVVFDGNVPAESGMKSCTDCAVSFKLDKVL